MQWSYKVPFFCKFQAFLHEYFDQNPISQFGLIITRNKRAELMSPLSGHLQKHFEAVDLLKKYIPAGEPSLQNSVDLATSILRHMPSHASREVLVIFGSLVSCDPGNILVSFTSFLWCIAAVQFFHLKISFFVLSHGHDFIAPYQGKSMEELKKNNIRVSIIGLSAEVRLCKLICKETNGDYGVILDEAHFRSLLFNQVRTAQSLF